MSRFWKEYGSKLFSLFIVITMLTVVYPVLVDTAKNPSQLSVYDDDWNDISEFASDLNKDSNTYEKSKEITQEKSKTINNPPPLPPIDGFRFELPPKLPSIPRGYALLVKGFGSGHGVGMSQWGAKGLAEKGAGFRKILTHFYKGAKVSKRYRN